MKKLLILALPVAVVGVVLTLWLANPAAVEHTHAAQHHQTQAVPSNALPPAVSLHADKDAMSGFNLTVAVKNYQMMLPVDDLVQTVVADNTRLSGHAHLYVNGVKIQRVYGRFVHIPKTLLKTGENTFRVTLNNHNHANWSQGGAAVQSELNVEYSKSVMAKSSAHGGHH